MTQLTVRRDGIRLRTPNVNVVAERPVDASKTVVFDLLPDGFVRVRLSTVVADDLPRQLHTFKIVDVKPDVWTVARQICAWRCLGREFNGEACIDPETRANTPCRATEDQLTLCGLHRLAQEITG